MTMNKQVILHKKIQESLDSLFAKRPEIPWYMKTNLVHELRDYQIEALEQFMFIKNEQADAHQYRHFLFHMATGSGKTSILAALILYLYAEYGHQCFMFFVNSNSIIGKTHLNLIDTSSNKYLFHPDRIEINGIQVKFEVVDVFPRYPAQGTIYLKLTTINKLHSDLVEPRENSITFEAIQQQKIVLLADEAHHINASTSKNKTDIENEKSWEHTVLKILDSHQDNLLLEFTATIDLTKQAIFDKYKDKIVYQYALEQFMNDGFSKGIYLANSDEDDIGKMIFAVLLSQYRRYLARKNGIDLKPIILFKSKKIMDSVHAMGNFLDIIRNLTIEDIQQVIQTFAPVAESNDLSYVYQFYLEVDLSRLLSDLQYDFKQEKVIAVNSKNEEDYAKLLNTLEHPGNPIRAVFAVDKLNEGWDVLNLYDIVRLKEGHSKKIKATNAEAQLIGRGARYYPFKYKGDLSYQRRFDTIDTPMRLLEQLYYHTINDSDYIKGLRNECKKEGIVYQELGDISKNIEVKIKETFKKKALYKHGKVFVNERVETTKMDYQSFADYKIDTKFIYKKNHLQVEGLYAGAENEREEAYVKHVRFKPDRLLFQKAIQKNQFFTFRNLKARMPGLESINQFIHDKSYLGGCEIYIENHERKLGRKEQLMIVEEFLRYVQKKISTNYSKYKGTRTFIGKAFRDVFKDYTLPGSIFATSATNLSVKKMGNSNWFIYNISVLNQLENKFVTEIQLWLERLNRKYNEIYLIRNEQQMKLYDFEQGRGFMPDFVLYVKEADAVYQVFLEPKGTHLLEKDKWKQDFLQSLTHEKGYEIFHETENIRIIGIKFFSDDPDLRNEFRTDFAKLILEGEPTEFVLENVPQDVMEEAILLKKINVDYERIQKLIEEKFGFDFTKSMYDALNI